MKAIRLFLYHIPASLRCLHVSLSALGYCFRLVVTAAPNSTRGFTISRRSYTEQEVERGKRSRIQQPDQTTYFLGYDISCGLKRLCGKKKIWLEKQYVEGAITHRLLRFQMTYAFVMANETMRDLRIYRPTCLHVAYGSG